MTDVSGHPARPRRLLASLALLATAVLALVGCETTGLAGWGAVPGEPRAERLAATGAHAEAAAVYISLATDASASERDRLTLLAVEQWLDAGDIATRSELLWLAAYRNRIFQLPPPLRVDSARILGALPKLTELVERLAVPAAVAVEVGRGAPESGFAKPRHPARSTTSRVAQPRGRSTPSWPSSATVIERSR